MPSLLILLCTTPPQVSILSWLFSSVVVGATLIVKTFFNELFFRHTTTLLKNKDLPKTSFFLILTTSYIYAAFYLFLDTDSTLHSSYALLALLTHRFIDGLQLALLAYTTQGIELSWGIGLANHLFSSVFIGYTPNSGAVYPLYTKQHSVAGLFNNITSPGKLTLFIIGTVMKSLCRLLCIYAVETQYRGRFVDGSTATPLYPAIGLPPPGSTTVTLAHRIQGDPAITVDENGQPLRDAPVSAVNEATTVIL